jgi:NTP pyrophosphatase (non-canonical NTP hydrolase)
MNLPELAQRNHSATVRRGLITEFTRKDEFILKMYEEVTELAQTKTDQHEAEELADIVTVCLCYAYHYSIDIEGALEIVALKNEQRND